MPADDTAAAPDGKRRPTADDLADLMFLVSEGKSLRAACRELGLDPPSTHTWLDEDDGRRQQYARARELRAEVHAERGLEIGLAAATGVAVEIDGEKHTIDPQGARTALDAIKWATARMSPKTAPTTKIDLTSRTRAMTDEEIAAELAEMGGATGEE
jgi:hypothetical protein